MNDNDIFLKIYRTIFFKFAFCNDYQENRMNNGLFKVIDVHFVKILNSIT